MIKDLARNNEEKQIVAFSNVRSSFYSRTNGNKTYDANGDCEKNLIDVVFPNLMENSGSAEYMTSHAILAMRNEFVDALNQKMIQMFSGESHIYSSYDQAIDDTNNYYSRNF
ncbi:conserved hypothetical protein [Ricinus communis]|uniref:Uncharacterized protein n=1 Tax=Ricinus communis TaxID=3988 RepID=B9SP89_RICCO|nr:conserved hypothetical protein [Ricinus communis]